MLRGVATAQAAGADAFKTWWTSSAERTCDRMSAPEMLPAYRLGQFPAAWLRHIREACHARGLDFLCTVDLESDIPVIAPHVDRFKVASWGAHDAEFLAAFHPYHKPLIISTGVTSDAHWAYLRKPIQWSAGVAWLHCVSAYPTPLEDVNLGAITRYRFDGFSDHTRRVEMGALAVAAGARILEVHFCLPETSERNPDRCVSHEPADLAEYIAQARTAALIVGDGVKRVMKSEAPNERFRYV
jgi:sialic acid synthase SpsE